MQEFIKEIVGCGTSFSGTTTLITSNKGIKDSMKIFKSPEDSGLLRNALLKQLRIIKKEQMVGFHGMSLVTSGVSLLGKILAG